MSPLPSLKPPRCSASLWAFYALARYVERPGFTAWFWVLVFSIGYSALLRPDGPLLGVVLVPAMFWYARPKISSARSLRLAIFCTLLAMIPFVPWTIRNQVSMHTFQPLAPRYANDPNEFVPHGWIRWIKSWVAEYTSTADTYWNVNGSPLDIIRCCRLACLRFSAGKSRDRKAVRGIQQDRNHVAGPGCAIQSTRPAAHLSRHPIRFYVVMPLVRLADMWLRPRTAQLWIELRWWQYEHHPAETLLPAGLTPRSTWPTFCWPPGDCASTCPSPPSWSPTRLCAACCCYRRNSRGTLHARVLPHDFRSRRRRAYRPRINSAARIHYASLLRWK